MLYSDMTPFIAIEVPGCPEFLMERALKEEIANLYRNHALWLYNTTATIATDGTIAVTPPTDTVIHEYRSLVLDDGTALTPVSIDHMQFNYYESTGTPNVVLQLNDVWQVRPLPTAETTANAVLQVGPDMTSTQVADAIANKHRSIYEHLALGRLQSMAGQLWTNLQMAASHETEAVRLIFQEIRRIDGWTTRRTPVVRYGGI